MSSLHQDHRNRNPITAKQIRVWVRGISHWCMAFAALKGSIESIDTKFTNSKSELSLRKSRLSFA